MSEEDVKQQLRTHVAVFVVILILAVMAGVSVIAGVSSAAAVMAVAAVEVVLVLVFLMHMRSDGPWVRGLLAFCALFLGALIGLLVLGIRDRIDGTEDIRIEAPAHRAEEVETEPGTTEEASGTETQTESGPESEE